MKNPPIKIPSYLSLRVRKQRDGGFVSCSSGKSREPGGRSRKIRALSSKEMPVLFQQFPPSVVFQHPHLLYRYLIELHKPFALQNALIDKHSIQIFHIGQTN